MLPNTARNSTDRPLALVTGASSGIGRAYAERLAADGHDLVVVARRGDRLEALKRRLESEQGGSVRAVVADLSTEAGMRDVDILVADSRIEVVVDCAALAHYMSFLDLPAEQAEELVRLNVLAPTRLIRAALPSMVQRGNGTIITFASQLVFSATSDSPQLPQRAVYTASKAFLFTFIRLLANEVRDAGIRLQVVCPAVVKTEFHTRQNLDYSHMPRLDPEQIVQASLVALDRGEIVCIPTVGDPDLLKHRDEAEIQLLMNGMRPELAARYSLHADLP